MGVPEILQKGVPGGVLEGPVKGQGHKGVHAVNLPEKLLPVLGRIDEPRGSAENQSVRVVREGHHTGPGPVLFRQIPAGPEQRLMA